MGWPLRATAVVMFIGVLIGCAAPSGPHYKHYRRLHPEWEAPELAPSLGVGLREVLALVDAPPLRRSNSKTVWELRVFAVHADYWVELLAASFIYEDEPVEEADYLVLAEVSCDRREPPFLHYSSRAYRWYFLKKGQLTSYRHSFFETRCAGLDFTVGEPPPVPGDALSADERALWDLPGEVSGES